MLKDDRMMSMLTFVVILIAVGTALQRYDVVGRFFGEGTVALEYQRDEAIVRANALSNIDVLANDLGLKEGDAENLIVVVQPKCGRVFALNGQVQYLPAERCAGSQTFKYAVSGRDRGKIGEVMVVVRIGDPTQSTAAADAQRDTPAPAPTALRTPEQSAGGAPASLAEQSQSGANTGGAIVEAPAVPRPKATAVAGLPDTASGAGPVVVGDNGSAAAGVTSDGSGRAPSLTAPSGGLTGASALSGPPVVPQSDQNAPGLSTAGLPAPPDSGQSGSERLTGTGAGNDGTAVIALAPPGPAATVAGEAAAPLIQRETAGLDANVPRVGPAEIGSGGAGQVGLTAPTDALAAVRELGNSVELAPVDTTPPAVLKDPNATPGTGSQPMARPQPDPAAATVAALPPPAAPCIVLPALTLDIQPAGITQVIIDSPCHANTAAELAYETLHFGIALDANGSGSIAAVGFQQASDATLHFDDGAGIAFNIPFIDTQKMDRVALVWDLPVKLELNAFEFGAVPGSPGHIRANNPRAHRDVRRHGGGYLLGYQPVYGIGDSVEVYTYWHRNGGKAGVVRLKLGVDSREGVAGSPICGDDARARSDFTILRSIAGRVERPQFRRLAPIDCTTVADMANRYISDAVDDLIVLRK